MDYKWWRYVPKIVDRHVEQPIFIKEYLRDYFKRLQEQDIHYLTLLGNQFVEEMRIEEELFYRCIFTHTSRHFTDHACRIERKKDHS